MIFFIILSIEYSVSKSKHFPCVTSEAKTVKKKKNLQTSLLKDIVQIKSVTLNDLILYFLVQFSLRLVLFFK